MKTRRRRSSQQKADGKNDPDLRHRLFLPRHRLPTRQPSLYHVNYFRTNYSTTTTPMMMMMMMMMNNVHRERDAHRKRETALECLPVHRVQSFVSTIDAVHDDGIEFRLSPRNLAAVVERVKGWVSMFFFLFLLLVGILGKSYVLVGDYITALFDEFVLRTVCTVVCRTRRVPEARRNSFFLF